MRSHRNTNTQDLTSWLISIPKHDRVAVYYDLANGWICTSREDQEREALSLIIRDSFRQMCYICAIDGHGANFLSPSQTVHDVN